MNPSDDDDTAYQVVVRGELGPAFLAYCVHSSATYCQTSSVFQFSTRGGQDIADLAATLDEAGLKILTIRQVPVREVWTAAAPWRRRSD